MQARPHARGAGGVAGHAPAPGAPAHSARPVAVPPPAYTDVAAVRGVGVDAVLAAVRAVPGVRDAEVRTAADGDRTLRLDLYDGVDSAAVAAQVAEVLDARLGVAAQLLPESADEPGAVPVPRDAPARLVLLERLQVITGGLDVSIEVALRAGDAAAIGHAVGPAYEPAVLRAVASATLAAVDRLVGAHGRCGLDAADLVEVGVERLAVAVVTLVTPGRVDRLAGAAVVRGDARQAMARAVLGALNRRLDALMLALGAPE